MRRRPGIIPARAGFTSRRTALPCASADHPRSRGVYTRRLSISSRARGSSPLARGLHAPMKDSSRIQGIIPARAGFTMPPTMKRLGHEGSSPLARGLRYRGQPSTGHAGIIPARAGFTTVMGRCEKSITDHPRSRGVYGLRHFYQRRKHGSSPLARGLLLEGAPRQAIVRIIPARAGFTCHSVTLHASPWDHPRSRGVYSTTAPNDPPLAGSSPLARGLLVISWRRSFLLRIIPARAGFTALSAGAGEVLGDHPRSRGVYRTSSTTSSNNSGSSPLARGLPDPG